MLCKEMRTVTPGQRRPFRRSETTKVASNLSRRGELAGEPEVYSGGLSCASTASPPGGRRSAGPRPGRGRALAAPRPGQARLPGQAPVRQAEMPRFSATPACLSAQSVKVVPPWPGPPLRGDTAAIGKHGPARSANSKCPRFQGNPALASACRTVGVSHAAEGGTSHEPQIRNC